MGNKGQKMSEYFRQGLKGLEVYLQNLMHDTRSDPALVAKIVEIMGNGNLQDYEKERLLLELKEPQYGEEMSNETLESILDSFKPKE
jgi:hypothetical protein